MSDVRALGAALGGELPGVARGAESARVSKRRPYIGPSDAQANAEALARRGSPYGTASEGSIRVAWDFRNREPRDLREAVRLCRRAYADEIPVKLHDGPDAIGEGGTPRFSSRAEGYLFGSPGADDAGRNAETGERDLVGYFHSPFRAALERMRHHPDSSVQAVG